MPLSKESSTLSPLGDVLSHGLIAVSTFGLLSFLASLSLFSYLTYHIVSHHLRSRQQKITNPAPINHFLVLIYNLLLADIQQAIAFLLNLSALGNNAITVGTPTCFAQGWFISTGDLASSVWICAIALQTVLTVVKGYKLPSWAFYTTIGCLWTFVYVMGALGPIIHGKEFYVRAGAWCWINSEFALERLWLHYFWIFICMFLTIILYTATILYLQFYPSPSSQSHTRNPSHLLLLYPIIYTLCTAPLAMGRIYALAGHSVSNAYFCFAGSMIACNGFLDVLLYASTRSEIVFSEDVTKTEVGLETFRWLGKGGRDFGISTTITGGAENRGSWEELYTLGRDGINVKEQVMVSVDVVGAEERGSGSASTTELRNWDSESHMDRDLIKEMR